MKTYKHGGPYDRGSADAYYGRVFSPHIWNDSTYPRVKTELKEGTEEYAEYLKGWNEQHASGDYKDWD